MHLLALLQSTSNKQQKLTRKIHNQRDFSISLSVTDRMYRQKLSRNREKQSVLIPII